VLSDRYRWLDIFDLPENVLPILQRLEGARFESEELADAKMYFKVITPASSSTSPRAPSTTPTSSSPGNELRHAVGAAADLPAGAQERPNRIGPRAAQARRKHRSRVDPGVQG
jgi:hypothetical protein